MAISFRASNSGGKKYNQGSGLTVTIPSGAVVGDIAFLWISYRTLNSDPDDYSVTTHADWTLVSSDITLNTFDNKGWLLYWKVVESGDPGASWVFSESGYMGNRWWGVAVFSGADATTPLGTVAKQKSTANTTTHTTPTVTTSLDGSWLLCFWTDNEADIEGVGGSPGPGSMTKAVDGTSGNSWPTVGAAHGMVWYELRATAGATGTRTFESENGDSDYCAMSVELIIGSQPQDLNEVSFGAIGHRSGTHRLETDTTATGAEAELGEETRGLVLLADLEPYDPLAGAVAPKYLSSAKYRSASGDTPSKKLYDAVLSSRLRLSRSILNGSLIGGRASQNIGQLSITNEREARTGAGKLDDWVYGLIWDDRPVTLRLAGRRRNGAHIPLSEAYEILHARTASLEASEPNLTLHLTDLTHRLARKAQTVTFAGTGGLEGPAELEGKDCPLMLGTVYGYAPPLLDRAARTYLLHRDAAGNQAQTPTVVRIGGNPIATDEWEYDTATSVLRPLVALDDNKILTVDGQGPSACGSSVSAIIRYLTSTIGPLAAADLDSPSLSVFLGRFPGEAGWLVKDGESVADVLDALVYPYGWWGFNRDGTMVVRAIEDPDWGFSDHSLTRSQVVSVRPMTSPPPVSILSVGFRKNWSQVGEDGVVDAARSSEYGQWMLTPSYNLLVENPDVEFLYPSAQTPEAIILPFNEKADAQPILDTLWAIYSRSWQGYEIVLNATGLRVSEGDVVTLTWSRWPGLPNGVRLLVLKSEVEDSMVTLTAWRPGPARALATQALDWIVTDAGKKIEVL